LADGDGALLVFDEVISGFRVARGGAQEAFGVDADLTVTGKVLGGGLPAAAYGGRRDLVERIEPAGGGLQGGPRAGYPLATAAGVATLRELDESTYRRLTELTDRLSSGLLEAADWRPVRIASAPGLLTLFFRPDPVRNFADASACDLDAYGSF